MSPAVAAGIAGIFSIAMTGLLLRYARRRLVEAPNARSSYLYPTPRGGGIAIVFGLFVGWLLAIGFAYPSESSRSRTNLLSLRSYGNAA